MSKPQTQMHMFMCTRGKPRQAPGKHVCLCALEASLSTRMYVLLYLIYETYMKVSRLPSNKSNKQTRVQYRLNSGYLA